MLYADAGAEQLQPPAGAGGLDLGSLERGAAAEILRYDRRERVNGGRTDDEDVIARGLGADRTAGNQRCDGSSRQALYVHVSLRGYLRYGLRSSRGPGDSV